MKKYIIITLVLLLAVFAIGYRSNSEPVTQVDTETVEPAQAEYAVNIDTVTQGEITYKKLVIHNHAEYTKDGILQRSTDIMKKVSAEKDVGEFGEVSIIFYEGKSMFCVVDPIVSEISYVR